MMGTSEVQEIIEAGDEIQGGLTMDTRKLDLIEGNGVNLQCINSSEFMVGKQTNFNGPVTIINCGDEADPTKFPRPGSNPEEVVIKERIMAPSLASTVQNFAAKRAEEEILGMRNSPTKKEKPSRVKWLCRRHLKIPVFAWIFLISLIVAGCVTAILELTSPDEYQESAEIIQGEDRNYTLYKRKHWGAQQEKASVIMKLPVAYLIVSNTDTRTCTGLQDCKPILRILQDDQISLTESDIYANFLVSSDGSIYEGRGWGKRNAYLGFANTLSLEINCIGDYVGYEEPTKELLGAIRALIAFAVKNNKLREHYSLIPANATGIRLNLDTPHLGKNLYEAIKDWPRFEPDPLQEISGVSVGKYGT